MEDIRLYFASNLSRLRAEKHMTQSELAELLNYSDKSVSKWERADAIPDAFVLKQLSEIFGVSIDYLLSEHDSWVPPEDADDEPFRWKNEVMGVSIAAIWAMAVLIFVIMWMLGNVQWMIFVGAVPATLVAALVLDSLWYSGKHNFYYITALVPALVALIFLLLLPKIYWQLFLVIVPAEVVVYYSFRIAKKCKK